MQYIRAPSWCTYSSQTCTTDQLRSLLVAKKSFQICLNSHHTIACIDPSPLPLSLPPPPSPPYSPHATHTMIHLRIGLIPGTAIGGFIGGALVTNLVTRLSSPPIRRGLFVRRRSRRPCPRCGGFGLAKCTLCSGSGICVSYTRMLLVALSCHKQKDAKLTPYSFPRVIVKRHYKNNAVPSVRDEETYSLCHVWRDWCAPFFAWDRQVVCRHTYLATLVGRHPKPFSSPHCPSHTLSLSTKTTGSSAPPRQSLSKPHESFMSFSLISHHLSARQYIR